MVNKFDPNMGVVTADIFGEQKLGDSRLDLRLEQIVSKVVREPEASFPNIFEEKAELDGFYRFVNNKRVESNSMFESIFHQTVRKAEGNPLVLAIHDTTTFKFSTQTVSNGLGRVTNKTRGFFGHFCIGINPNREILGLLGLKHWIRPEKRKGKMSRDEFKADETNEGLKWSELILKAQGRLSSIHNVIHVADREADDYVTLSKLIQSEIKFVIRADKDRRILDENHGHVRSSLREAKVICTREVPISERKKKQGIKIPPNKLKTHPLRQKRTVELGVAAKTITIHRTIHAAAHKGLVKTLDINFVRVFEIEPPNNETPIEWILMTSEPIQTTEDLLKIADIYCMRWTIEEYFKVLKTGFSFEKRRLDSLHALLNCLAIFAPIACAVYNLKLLGTKHPESPAIKVLTAIQIKILAAHMKKQESALANAGCALLAVAQLGGHLKHNGPPGWQILIRGFEKLLQMEIGWKLLQDKTSSTYPPLHIAICEE